MAKRTGIWLAAGFVLATVAGCAQNTISGPGGQFEEIYQGSLRITGPDKQVILLPDSDVPKLSIRGDNNSVIIRDGVTIDKIEIFGVDNEVTCPKDLEFDYSEFGVGNRLKYRP